MDRNAVRAAVARSFRPQSAGMYAGDVPLLRVANVVGGTRLCVELDQQLKDHMFTLDTKQFHGSSARLVLGDLVAGRNVVTALIFRPGSMQIVGAQNATILQLALHRIADVLRAHGRRPHMLFVSIDNCVATSGIDTEIALEQLVDCLYGYDTQYCPGVFPGLICLPFKRGRAPAMMVFESGRMMALGVSSVEAANRTFLSFAAIARSHASGVAVSGQRSKSLERQARSYSEQHAQTIDATRRTRRRVSAQLIGKAVQDFMAETAELRRTPGYSAQLRAHLDRLVSDATADAPGRRRQAAADDADDELADDLIG